MLAVTKHKRYALSGPSSGCTDHRQRQRQHEVKDRKMRVPLVSLVPYYLELTNCAGPRQVRWLLSKIKDTRSRSRSQRPSPGALAVPKDKRYALSGLSPGCTGRHQRQRQHEVKDRKMRVPRVSPSPVLPGVNKLRGLSTGCAGCLQR